MLIAVIITIIIFFTFIISIIISYKSTHPNTLSIEESKNLEFFENTYNIHYLEDLEKYPILIQSKYHYSIHGYYLPNKCTSNKIIIINHGYECTLYRSIKYVNIFHKLGFSCIVYDLRNHGKSGGTFSSFGFYEKEDLKTIVDFVQLNYPKYTYYGTLGSSMGAAITLQHASIDPRIQFVISESAFCDLNTQIKRQLNNKFKKLSKLFLFTSSFTNKILYGYYYEEVSPMKSISTLHVPILFIHGDQDQFIPFDDSLIMHTQSRHFTFLEIINGAGHGKCFNINKEQYERIINNFLIKI